MLSSPPKNHFFPFYNWSYLLRLRSQPSRLIGLYVAFFEINIFFLSRDAWMWNIFSTVSSNLQNVFFRKMMSALLSYISTSDWIGFHVLFLERNSFSVARRTNLKYFFYRSLHLIKSIYSQNDAWTFMIYYTVKQQKYAKY